MDSEMRPRLCFLTKGARGYGFHLHGERNKGGQFIRKVEPGSSADLSGLLAGDRVVEVNGENVEHETHHHVVSCIRVQEHRVRLLVVDRITEDFLSSHGLPCSEALAVHLGTLSPRTSPPPPPRTPPAAPHDGARPRLGRRGCFFTSFHFLSFSNVNFLIVSQSRLELSGLPTTTKTELVPRLCHLVKGVLGYGFNLHSDKTRHGQFIRSIDPDSPAQLADLRPLDRLVEVNRVNIEGLRHSEVVALIRGGAEETRLLVVDPETDELFKRLGVTPTESHIKEVYVDEPESESVPPTPLPYMDPPIINVTLMDPPITINSPKLRTNGSSASQSSSGSTTQSEFSSSDMSIQIPEDEERCVLDHFLDSGLRLSPTAAEAKEKARAKRSKKTAPPMDWSQKQQIFSNL
ncbi:Na(+)/H(+) exchange regulatory cofactor NHE-RF2-like [Osmerus eperlanus]|uniref:Na(+)/H(+) exchange regulatory cofactor NHE-RF2-like n=1 Tax=Osmerus eperlanus TaxID=29151 RepID=UPI002E15DF23